MRIRSVFPIVVCLLTVACANMPNPLSPSESRQADLTITIDGQCSAKGVVTADVFIDGVFQAEVRVGSSTTKTVDYGVHHVEAATYYANRVLALKWGPERVDVQKGGFRELFHC